MIQHKLRKAFTFLELTFVIAILGIVASIGSEIIVRVYEQYIVQKAQHKSAFKTELVALQIANRLRDAIPGTVFRILNNDNLEPLSSTAGLTDDYKGLLWVGASGESFEASDGSPGWSGLCDLNNTVTSKNSIVTPGSDLTLASSIITNLGGNIVGSKLFFANETNATTDHNISSVTNTTATITLTNIGGATPRRVSEHYKLAWTSYALVVVGGDLRLYYNFPATRAANYTTESNNVLMENISSFKFSGSEAGIRFKVCQDENITATSTITACKEKAIY